MSDEVIIKDGIDRAFVEWFKFVFKIHPENDKEQQNVREMKAIFEAGYLANPGDLEYKHFIKASCKDRRSKF